jgi:hypothetical protein
MRSPGPGWSIECPGPRSISSRGAAYARRHRQWRRLLWPELGSGASSQSHSAMPATGASCRRRSRAGRSLRACRRRSRVGRSLRACGRRSRVGRRVRTRPAPFGRELRDALAEALSRSLALQPLYRQGQPRCGGRPLLSVAGLVAFAFGERMRPSLSTRRLSAHSATKERLAARAQPTGHCMFCVCAAVQSASDAHGQLGVILARPASGARPRGGFR